MKKIFKTIVYGFAAVALFGFSANSVLAATVFNNHSNDYPTILVSNYTDNPGSNSNWSSSVSADAGDIVSVLVYYHNNGSEDAVSTKLKINNGQTLGSAWTHTFSGSVSAFNANQVSGSATVNISSSQSLTYVSGSASWYANNQSTTEYALPNGQSGTEVFSSSGVNIGTIAPGWASQGSFVVQYKVSGNSQPQDQAPIVTTNSYSLNGNQATLHGHVDGQGENPYTYFVYGTNSNLNGGNSTVQDYQNQTTTNFSETVYVNDNTTYYYKACATTDGGSDCGVIKSFWTGDNNGGNDEDIEVTTLSAQNVQENSATLRGDIIETNGEDVERYFEYGEDEDDLDEVVYLSGQTDNEGIFSKTINGLDDNTTYYFRACIESQDSNDEDCGSIKSFKTDKVIYGCGNCGIPVCQAYATTTYATGISSTSAVLNGVSKAGNSSASSYFQYGTTTGNIGSSVGYQTVSSCGSLYNSYNLTGLQPNTTYYYRIVTGSTHGEIKSFTTPAKSIVVIPQPPKPKPTPTPKPTDDDGSLIYLALDITPDFENVYEGDTVNFDVDYRNLYNGTLEDVVINVRFPEEIEFRKSTQGVYSELDRSLAIELGDLKDDEEGTILIQADILGRLNGQGVVVTTAEGTYVHPIIENAQGSSMAHALNTILEKQSVFDFDSLGIFGWLILILLILLIIWISRKIYHDHEDRKNQKPTFQIN